MKRYRIMNRVAKQWWEGRHRKKAGAFAIYSRDLEKVVDRIVKSAGRLSTSVELPRRDEKWWAAVAKEDWQLIKLSWELRGLILSRDKGAAEAEQDKLKHGSQPAQL